MSVARRIQREASRERDSDSVGVAVMDATISLGTLVDILFYGGLLAFGICIHIRVKRLERLHRRE